MQPGVRFFVLGPFEVHVDGRPVTVRGRQRIVLAALVLFAGRPVSHETLAAYAWQEDPPRQVRGSLQTIVARLRRQLGAATILTTDHGYQLVGDAETVDLLRFRALVKAAARCREADDLTGEYDHLNTATGLWRGNPFCDVPSDQLRNEATPRVQEEWFRAVERRLSIAFSRDRHREVISELWSLTTTYPFRESLWNLLIRALHRSGRRGEALEAYQRAAAVLRDQLGLDPGTELSQLQQAILADEPGTAAAPEPTPRSPRTRPLRQLPADIAGFTGREEALTTLDAHLAALDAAPTDRARSDGNWPVPITAIDGTAGVGKTALAVHWAHTVSDRFPDGQLYVNLRGFGPGQPVDPTDALEEMLRSLDVEPGRMPRDLDARSALLRSELADRRVLLVLDNARDSAQVRPLLPGDGTVMVIITSRTRLGGLVARDGAHRVTLDQLTEPEALSLLAGIVGADRITAEPAAARAVVDRCARLPLAIRVAAENVTVAHGTTDGALTELLEELDAEQARLDTLSVDDDLSADLRAVFSWSYDTLPTPAARMFRLLGLHPGDTFTVEIAATVTGLDNRTAAATLDVLIANHLVERVQGRRNPVGHCHQFHDLLREYAREKAVETDRAGERAATIERLVSWYLHTAANAREKISDSAHRMSLSPPPAGVSPLTFTDYRSATTWFERNHRGILAIVRLAYEAGHYGQTARLAQVCWLHLYSRATTDDMCEIGELAVVAACRHGDRFLEAKCRNGLGAPYRARKDYDESVATCRRAFALFEELNEPAEQIIALSNMCVSYNYARRFTEAIATARRALPLMTADHGVHRAILYNNMAQSFIGLDRPVEALASARKAVEQFSGGGDPARYVSTLDTLGHAQHVAGDHPAAIATFREVIGEADRLRIPWLSKDAKVRLGQALAASGDLGAARTSWRAALEEAVQLGDPTDEIEALLADGGAERKA